MLSILHQNLHMKKLFLSLAISSFSLLSFAQPGAESNEIANDSTVKEITVSNDRITKLENEIKELKAANQQLQQQLAEVKKQMPVKKKKLVVSRTSSKQGVWVDE